MTGRAFSSTCFLCFFLSGDKMQTLTVRASDSLENAFGEIKPLFPFTDDKLVEHLTTFVNCNHSDRVSALNTPAKQWVAKHLINTESSMVRNSVISNLINFTIECNIMLTKEFTTLTLGIDDDSLTITLNTGAL